ncbi:MAG: leucine-rich repeat protein, partial [Christensenellales bacterium]
MIINLKYNSQTGLLTPMANYTLAQHNHLADKIVVTSNAPDCADYNYCLEFVCYNTKNVPKTQYVSEILNYTPDGIVFDVPNNLTQYAGFVDVQLTGYSKDNYNVIFKSISKNTKAFSVEGSLSVLDNALSDTPNILTLLQQELDYVREVKQTIANDFENLINNDLGQVLEDFEYSCVTFIFYDKTYCKTYKNNSTITPPILNLTESETLLGWVDESGRVWNFDEDRVQGSLTLIANVQSVGVEVQGGKWTSYSGVAYDVFVPYCADGILTTAIGDDLAVSEDKGTLYLPPSVEDCSGLRTSKFSAIKGGSNTATEDGIFYDLLGARVVGATRDRLNSTDTITVKEGVNEIGKYAFCGAQANEIILPQSVDKIGEKSLGECVNLTEITLPAFVNEIAVGAFEGCGENLKIVLLSRGVPSASREAWQLSTDKYAEILVPYWSQADCQADEAWGDLVKPLGVDLIGNLQAVDQKVEQVEEDLLSQLQELTTKTTQSDNVLRSRIDAIEEESVLTDERLQSSIDILDANYLMIRDFAGQNSVTIEQQGNILKKLYAVGCIYMSTNSTSPASLFGGT